ncbi:hypothetical protein MUA01_20595 [Enterobacteriaceae bacterium H18W14]|uniref:hypothetical protein n=1 Tax=Dryocola boscaweniae TaxID=2925397 RepID=UPI0022EFE7E4|nr:hypothetical protein [Dryocola boscaweniae]MCT4717356.1 hypothetical protein [Dryocola boscaweniae]
MSYDKAYKKRKTINISNDIQMQCKKFTEISKEATDIVPLFHLPSPLLLIKSAGLKDSYFTRTENTIAEYQADTEYKPLIATVDSNQDKREFKDNIYICGCGCEDCCGCGHDL